MDLVKLSQALRARDVTLVKLTNEDGQVIVLVRKNETNEEICWFWNDMGFNSGVYGVDAARTFVARSLLVSRTIKERIV